MGSPEDTDDWEANIATKPDGITQEELQAALATRLAELGPVIAVEVPPSMDETVELQKVP
jgi:hypothetical protein